MSSVEGMWQMQTGTVDAPFKLNWGGIIILESGRIFGGDSGRAYKGSYQVKDKRLEAHAKSWLWNPVVVGSFETAFGDDVSTPHEVESLCDVDDGNLVGFLWRKDQPAAKLAIKLTKICELD